MSEQEAGPDAWGLAIQISLDPLDESVVWGEEPGRHISWFGLSVGTYWIRVGTARLLYYSPDAPGGARPVDYQVARLHEDLLELLPGVLAAVPHEVVSLMPGKSLIAATDMLKTVMDQADEDTGFDTDSRIWRALITVGARKLDTTYLSPAANIWMWRCDDRVVVEWDHRGNLVDSEQWWESERGRVEVGLEEFVIEIQSFHERFTRGMRARVASLAGGHPLSRFVDAKRLWAEQAFREAALDGALKSGDVEGDWKAVRAELAAALGAGAP